jgi:hypothetical protein
MTAIDVSVSGALGGRRPDARDHTDVDPVRDRIDDRDDAEQTRALQRTKPPESQHHRSLPGRRDPDRAGRNRRLRDTA